MLALCCLGACAPMQTPDRPAVVPRVQTEDSFRSSAAGSDADNASGCPSCGVVRSITQIAGGSVVSEASNDEGRFNVYRIEVEMGSGDNHSIDQRDPEGLHKGSLIEMRDQHVYPRD